MPTTSEAVLAALEAALAASLPAGVLAERNTVLPEVIPTGGVAILRDGTPGELEVTLSPLAWHYQHRAEIDVLAIGAARDAVFDTIKAAIGVAVAADRSLGGRCDWVEAEAPQPTALVADGSDEIKAATITLVLHYTTTDPLA